MRKFTLLALSGLLAVATAMAAPAHKGENRFPAHKEVAVKTFRTHNADLSKRAHSSAAKAKAKKLSYDDSIIWWADGESFDLVNHASGFGLSLFGGIFYNEMEAASEIVYGEDNEVYIKEILSGVSCEGTYVKGSIDGDIITIKFPQPVYAGYDEETEEMFTLFANVCVQKVVWTPETGDQLTYVPVAEEENFVQYKVDEDGNLTLLLNDGDPADFDTYPAKIIGLVEDAEEGSLSWWGVGDAYQSMSVFNAEAPEMPETAEADTWIWKTEDEYSGVCQIGFDSDKVYIQGLFKEDPDVCIVGDMKEDGKIEFTFPQYLGYDWDMNQYIYMCSWQFTDEDFSDFFSIDKVTFNYDKEARTITVDGELIDLTVNWGTLYPDYYDDYYMVEFFQQDPEAVNAAPTNPEVDDYMLYDDHWGYGYVTWVIPVTNVNGAYLNPDNMFYRVYFDDELMTFDPEVYGMFEEEMTDIPYYFTDVYDVVIWGEKHEISFYEDFQKFGLQSFFTNAEGTTFASELVTYDASGVNTVGADKTVSTIEFYNLQGQRVNHPERGLYIQRVNYTDGTVKTSKAIIR